MDLLQLAEQERNSREYAEGYFNEEAEMRGIFKSDTRILDSLIARKGRILDAAMGPGRHVRHFVEKGFEVLRFDFRAHGQSTGEFMDFTVDGELQDLDAAHSFVKSLHSKVDDRGRVQQSDWKIGLLGASFGGGIAAMHAAGNVDIQALCLWNPALAYSDYYSGNPRTAKNKARFSKEKLEFLEAHGYLDVNQKKFRVGRQWIASLKAHNPMESLHRITQPTLVVHGEADASVPVQDSIEANKQLAKGTLEILENAEHGFHEPEAERLAVLLTVKFFDEKLKP